MKSILSITAWILLLLLGVSSCKNANRTEIIGCFPAEHLPEYITPLTPYGQRVEWALDNKGVYFVDKAGGNVFYSDIATKEITQITDSTMHPKEYGYYRVFALSNGDLLFTCGPERHDAYAQIMKKGTGKIHNLNEKMDEGPTISRTDMKIVWTPDQQVIYSGMIVINEDSSNIIDKTLIIDNDSVVVDGIKYEGILESQNFIRPEEVEFTWTQYGNTEAGLFTSEVMTYNLETGVITNHSKSPTEYSEPEGIFPDGKSTLIECDAHCHLGIKQIDIYRMKLDGSGEIMERLTHFNDIEGYKGSNPVVSDDGKYIAFQSAYAKAAAGQGCGLYLLDLEKFKQNTTQL
ncbi:MAG: hypothetical protein HKN87_14775 [Saprospiraceae bacterium]|nr:hypothetical protein [Saprospiraceae bacterium]